MSAFHKFNKIIKKQTQPVNYISNFCCIMLLSGPEDWLQGFTRTFDHMTSEFQQMCVVRP